MDILKIVFFGFPLIFAFFVLKSIFPRRLNVKFAIIIDRLKGSKVFRTLDRLKGSKVFRTLFSIFGFILFSSPVPTPVSMIGYYFGILFHGSTYLVWDTFHGLGNGIDFFPFFFIMIFSILGLIIWRKNYQKTTVEMVVIVVIGLLVILFNTPTFIHLVYGLITSPDKMEFLRFEFELTNNDIHLASNVPLTYMIFILPILVTIFVGITISDLIKGLRQTRNVQEKIKLT